MFTPNRSLSIDDLEADHDQIVSRRDAHGLRKGWVAVKLCGIEIADWVDAEILSILTMPCGRTQGFHDHLRELH